MKVLFVCRANVGRSQMAEEILRSYHLPGADVSSAGTKVVDQERNSTEGQKLKDKDGAENVILVMEEKDIDVRENTRTQLSKEMVEENDLVVIMAEKESCPDYLADEKYKDKILYWDLVDPKGMDLEQTRIKRDEIGGLIDFLVKDLKLKTSE